jgi:hypothetical protein
MTTKDSDDNERRVTTTSTSSCAPAVDRRDDSRVGVLMDEDEWTVRVAMSE